MRRLVRLSLSLLALAAPVFSARAQLAELQPGARVRITAPGIVSGRFTGTVLSRSADTLVLGALNSAPVSVPIDRMTSAELSRGSSRSLGARRGLMWGVPIGVVAGALSDAVHDDSRLSCSADVCYPHENDTAKQLLVGALAGAAWGAGVGALVGRERWERFDVAPRGSFDYRDGRARFGAAVRF